MDIISSIKSVKYVHSLLAGDRENILNYPYVPQKPEYTEKEQTMPLPRVTPEQVGISSTYVFDFFEELCSKTDVNGHNILMMRNGKVFAQGEFSPYRKEVWHVTHSLCKSITAMAIGMLIDEGKLSLDDKVCEILKVKSFLAQASVVRKLTVENLLCMSSGVDYGEIAIIAENDWLNGFFKAGVEFEPGKRFAYNSMNTYLLSCIVKTVSGEGLIDYLTPRILKPLGITNIAWEKSSKDIEKGGWGLYLTIEDAAKLGQLLLQGGKWTVDGKEKK
ncbi:MAG: serine hydrolase, partial [Oscillospiraceae bacterium]